MEEEDRTEVNTPLHMNKVDIAVGRAEMLGGFIVGSAATYLLNRNFKEADPCGCASTISGILIIGAGFYIGRRAQKKYEALMNIKVDDPEGKIAFTEELLGRELKPGQKEMLEGKLKELRMSLSQEVDGTSNMRTELRNILLEKLGVSLERYTRFKLVLAHHTGRVIMGIGIGVLATGSLLYPNQSDEISNMMNDLRELFTQH